MPLPLERRREWEREWSKKRRLEKPEYFLWKAAKRRAKTKELDFDITVEDIIIPQFCPLLNIPITHQTGLGKRTDGSPSLDRIDNRFGYVRGNILVISWRANFLKSDASLQELQLLTKNLETITLNK